MSFIFQLSLTRKLLKLCLEYPKISAILTCLTDLNAMISLNVLDTCITIHHHFIYNNTSILFTCQHVQFIEMRLVYNYNVKIHHLYLLFLCFML